MPELYPDEYFWAGLLSCFGIPVMTTTEIKHTNSIIAVSGQYFRNLNGDQLMELFKDNFIIMDGGAAFTLYDMGYGSLAGINSAEANNISGFCSYEQVCNDKTYMGLKDARYGTSEKYVMIKYNEK